MLSLDTNYLLDDKSNIKRQSRCLPSSPQIRPMIILVLLPTVVERILHSTEIIYNSYTKKIPSTSLWDLVLYLDTLPLTTSKSLFYHQCTSLLIHTTTILCISIIEDHNHFCVPSHHHPNTNTPPHIQQLLLDKTTTRQSKNTSFQPLRHQYTQPLRKTPYPIKRVVLLHIVHYHFFNPCIKKPEYREKWNEISYRWKPQHKTSTSIHSSSRTHRGLSSSSKRSGIRKRSSSKTSFP